MVDNGDVSDPRPKNRPEVLVLWGRMYEDRDIVRAIKAGRFKTLVEVREMVRARSSTIWSLLNEREAEVKDPTQTVGSGDEWSRGYFCAVATLLRLEGAVTPQIHELFASSGDGAKVVHADEDDQVLFRSHGLVKS